MNAMSSTKTGMTCRVLGLVAAALIVVVPPASAAEPEPGPAGNVGPRPKRSMDPADTGPPGRGEFGRRHRRPLYEHLREDVRLEVLDFIEEHFADMSAELIDLRYENSDEFVRKMNRFLPQMLQLMRLEQEDPKMFGLRVQEVGVSLKIRAQARRLRVRGSREYDEKQVAPLRKLLVKRFELQQRIHRIEVQRLERRLAEAKERLDQAEVDKESVVAQELEEMLMAPRRQPRGKRLHGRPALSDEPRP